MTRTSRLASLGLFALALCAQTARAADTSSPPPSNRFLTPELARRLAAEPASAFPSGGVSGLRDGKGAGSTLQQVEAAQARVNESRRPVCVTRTGNEVPCTSPRAARLLKPDVRPRPAMSTRTTMAPTQPRLFFSIGEPK